MPAVRHRPTPSHGVPSSQTHKPTLTWTVLTLLVMVTTACTPEREQDAYWLEQVHDSLVTHSVVVAGACLDCIVRNEVIRFGDDDGPGYLRTVPSAAIDSSGNYLLSQAYGPKVFDPSGQFVTQLGREGQGPGEFLSQAYIYVDPDGLIHAFDTENVRETVFDSQYRLHEDHRLDGPPRFIEPLAESGRVVANLNLPTEELIGLPLHVLDRGRIVNSFGTQVGAHPLNMGRVVALDSQGRIFSAADPTTAEYEVEVWSPEGRRIAGLARGGLWESPGGSGPLTEENPPRPFVQAIHVDANHRLWVILWIARPDWLDNIEEVLLPNGTIGQQPKGGTDSVYMSVVDVIDLKTGELEHSAGFFGILLDFFKDGLVYGAGETEWGAPQFVVWTVNVES